MCCMWLSVLCVVCVVCVVECGVCVIGANLWQCKERY